MKRTIGIIAPLIDKHQFHTDFNLRLRLNNRELTLAALYDFALAGFNSGQVSRGIDHEEDMPAAGYYLEGLLRQNGYDPLLTNRYDAETLKTVADRNPFAVLVSTTMIVTTGSLLELLSSIRSAMPDTVIIAGGVSVWKNYLLYKRYLESQQPSELPSWMLFHPDHSKMDADVLVVAPHGRSSLLEVLAELEKGRNASFGHIPNLALPGNKGFSFTKMEQEQVDYNKDFTRWDLITSVSSKIPLRTSIGCPYRCRFCDFYRISPVTFIRSPESLAEELKLVKQRLGPTPMIVHVSDDNVFISRKRLQEVCTTLAGSGCRKWIGFMRAREFSGAELDLIERSGLMMGMIGVESGDAGQLQRMNKRQKTESVKRGVEQLDTRGISTLMTFIVGFPGENRDTLEHTAGFLNTLSLSNLLSSYQLYPLVIHPLSELADPAVRAEWKIEGFMEKWSHSTMNSEEAFNASYSLFREVTNVPYHYSEESNFFNRAKFRLPVRRSLFHLRQQLTVRLIENEPWERIEPVLKDIAQQMNISAENIPESVRLEISAPSIR